MKQILNIIMMLKGIKLFVLNMIMIALMDILILIVQLMNVNNQ